jgi:tetratricopeptide (TPR) repeat protein
MDLRRSDPAWGSKQEPEDDDQRAAWNAFRRAYQRQMKGEFDEAIKLYTESIELYPTAEAFTFRGWTYSFMGMLDEAIEDCHRAIAVDPDFGNPYNDIGAYLIEREQFDDAIEWLERATRAKRYKNPAFPHLNLGRVYEKKREWQKAMESYQRALTINPEYDQAQKAFSRLRAMMN